MNECQYSNLRTKLRLGYGIIILTYVCVLLFLLNMINSGEWLLDIGFFRDLQAFIYFAMFVCLLRTQFTSEY